MSGCWTRSSAHPLGLRARDPPAGWGLLTPHRCLAQRGEAACPKARSGAALSLGTRHGAQRPHCCTYGLQRPAVGMLEPLSEFEANAIWRGVPWRSGRLRNNRKATLEGVYMQRCPLGPGQAWVSITLTGADSRPALGDICCTNKHLFLEANIFAVKARASMAGE